MDMVKELVSDVLVFEYGSVRFYVLLKVMLFIDGIVVDYVCEGLN